MLYGMNYTKLNYDNFNKSVWLPQRKQVVTKKHPNSGQNPTKDELDQIIADADIDGDGQIDFEEFVVMMNRQEARDLAGFYTFFLKN